MFLYIKPQMKECAQRCPRSNFGPFAIARKDQHLSAFSVMLSKQQKKKEETPQSTSLSDAFAKQGVKVEVRKKVGEGVQSPTKA